MSKKNLLRILLLLLLSGTLGSPNLLKADGFPKPTCNPDGTNTCIVR